MWIDRAIAAAIALAALAATAFLASVDPDPRGYDTHVQLGMAPCGWPKAYGIPCPTCGATTAAALVVHGRLLAAVATQPFGAAVAMSGLVLGVLASYCLVRSRSFLDVWLQLPRQRLLLAGIALLFLAWGYKAMVFDGVSPSRQGG